MLFRIKNLKNKYIANEFAKNIIDVFKGKIVLYLLGFIASVYIARILQPEGKGIYAVISSYSALVVQFFNFGIHSANTFYISKNPQNVGKCIGNNILITLITVIFCVVVMGIAYFNKGLWGKNCFIIDCSLIFSIPLLLIMLQENIFLALNKIKLFNWLQYLQNFLPIVVIFLASFCVTSNVKLVTYVFIIISFLIAVLSIVLCRCININKIEVSLKYLKNVSKYSIKAYLACLITNLIFKIDVIMMSSRCSDSEIGLYSLAASLAELLYMVASAINLVLFPRLSAISDSEIKKEILKKNTKMIAIITILCGLFMFLFSEPIIYIYGSAYLETVPMMRILIIAVIFWSLSSTSYSYFASEDKQTVVIVLSILVLFINVVLNYYLIPQYKGIGAGIASLISYAINCFIMVIAMLLSIKNGKSVNGL